MTSRIEDYALSDNSVAWLGGVRSSAISPPVTLRRFAQGGDTHSMIMRSRSGTVRYIEAHHALETKHCQPE